MNRTCTQLKRLTALAAPAAVLAAAPTPCGTRPPGNPSGGCPAGTDRRRDVTRARPQSVCTR